MTSTTRNEAAEQLDIVRLTAGVHDWFCGGKHTDSRRPYIGWPCERGARRIFDIYTDQTADWATFEALLNKTANR